MHPTSSRPGHRPKTQVTNPFQRASSRQSHLGLLKRLDITGARWGLDGAEAILTLRALISNGDFDDYWRYHLTQEHQRLYPAQPKSGHSE